MGRPKELSGSLGNGECKVVIQLDPETRVQTVGLRFNSLGKYVSFYATEAGLEELVRRAGEALKILRK